MTRVGITYVHDKDPGFVELVDDLFGWDTDGTDKQLCLFLDNDIDKVIEFTFGVVVIRLSSVGPKRGNEQINTECLARQLELPSTFKVRGRSKAYVDRET